MSFYRERTSQLVKTREKGEKRWRGHARGMTCDILSSALHTYHDKRFLRPKNDVA